MQVININLQPKKCSGQSRYGRYGSYATEIDEQQQERAKLHNTLQIGIAEVHGQEWETNSFGLTTNEMLCGSELNHFTN